MTDRKNGRRKIDLSDESTAKVLKTAKTLIRTDWGGRDPDEQIKKEAEEAGIDWGPKSRELARKIAERHVESCRKRQFPRIDEAIRRLEEKKPEPVESAP
jgi:hypothetical protein